MSIRTSISNNILRSVLLLLAVALTLSIVCTASVSAHTGEGHDNLAWNEWATSDNLPDAGNYCLMTDVTLSAVWKPTGTVNLCLNGHVIEQTGNVGVIEISKNNILNIYDCNTTAVHYFTKETSGLWKLDDTQTNSEYSVIGGVITGGERDRGAGIYSYGTLNIYGGNLVGNRGTDSGGGGCIRLQQGTGTLDGGSIIGNTHEGWGGGIGVMENAAFTMNSGSISHNVAGGNGGGIYVGGGRFELLGGEISNNEAKGTTSASSSTGAKGEGGGVYTRGSSGDSVITFSGGTFTDNMASNGGNGVTIGIYSNNAAKSVIVSGNFYLSDDQTFRLTDMPRDSKGIQLDGFTGLLRKVDIGRDSIEGQVIFTVLNSGSVSDALSHVGLLNSEKWALSPGTDGKISATLNVPKVSSATVEWYNSTTANVTLQLTSIGNDADKIEIVFNNTATSEKTKKTYTGNFAAGSTISDIQVTGLTPGNVYDVQITSTNSAITFTPKGLTHTMSGTYTAPTPSEIRITDALGNEINGAVALSSDVTEVTFGVHVYDGSTPAKLLKDEPVTWSGVGITDQEATEISVYTSGISDTANILTASISYGSTPTPVSGSVTFQTGSALMPTSLGLTADKTIVSPGESVKLIPTATDGTNQLTGVAVTWLINGVEDINSLIDGSTGFVSTFTPTLSGSYAITAKYGDSLSSEAVTITVIGKPTVTMNTVDQILTVGESVTLKATPTAPTGDGTLQYQWQSSTDKTFTVGVTDIGSLASVTSGTEVTYSPSTDDVGFMYYRVNVTYTENEVTTFVHSNPVKVTVEKVVPDMLTLTNGDVEVADGTTITLYQGYSHPITLTATASKGDMNDFGINWVVSPAGEYVDMTTSGNQATITPKAVGTSTLVVSAADNVDLAKTVTIEVIAMDYTLVIPPTIEIHSETGKGEIRISSPSLRIPPETAVTISLDSGNDFNLKYTGGDESSIRYKLTETDSNDAPAIGDNSQIAAFRMGATNSVTLYAWLDGVDPSYAGTYQDTLTFMITPPTGA